MSTSTAEHEGRNDDARTQRRDDGWPIAVTFVLLGSGILTGSPLLMALAVVPLGFVAATAFDSLPESSLALEREVTVMDDSAFAPADSDGVSGDPGERVTVRLTVHNTGADPVVDLRVLDGVPAEIPVVSGSSRACLTVRPDETAVVEYTVELRRGEHTFGEAVVRNRSPGGTVMQTETEAVAGDRHLECYPAVEQVPVEEGTHDYAGQIPTDEGGTGVEFYSVREYEPGDPVRSIDWRRYANTRELATIEFRAERATRVVCLVDRRRSQRRAGSPDHLPGIDLSVAAAERTFTATIDAGYPTGIIGFNDRHQVILEPGTDDRTRVTGLDLLEAIREQKNPSEHVQKRWGSPSSVIPPLLPGEAQIILFSSFVDDPPLKLVERLRIQGYDVCVVSPDVATPREDSAGRLNALNRRTRLANVRKHGARVVDWHMDEPLGVVLDRVVTEVS